MTDSRACFSYRTQHSKGYSSQLGEPDLEVSCSLTRTLNVMTDSRACFSDRTQHSKRYSSQLSEPDLEVGCGLARTQ